MQRPTRLPSRRRPGLAGALAAAAAMTLVARTASAEDGAVEPTTAPVHAGYVSVGAAASGDAFLYLTGIVEGGLRVHDRGVYLRGRLAHGLGLDAEASGSVSEATAGVEGRRCTARARACASVGVDAGLVAGRLVHADHVHELSSVVLTLRGAVDLGLTRAVALRVGAEGRRLVDRPDVMSPTSGAGLSVGVVARF
jgi:hypothetical protein